MTDQIDGKDGGYAPMIDSYTDPRPKGPSNPLTAYQCAECGRWGNIAVSVYSQLKLLRKVGWNIQFDEEDEQWHALCPECSGEGARKQAVLDRMQQLATEAGGGKAQEFLEQAREDCADD